jgi:hypothetical protein
MTRRQGHRQMQVQEPQEPPCDLVDDTTFGTFGQYLFKSTLEVLGRLRTRNG